MSATRAYAIFLRVLVGNSGFARPFLEAGSEKTFEFDQSPIRVGRNALNNIVFEDRFVSQWHGMLRFDQTSVTYVDLGSTNRTRLQGGELKAVFADMGIHHLALMEGITQGIRALLEFLDPGMQDAGSGHFSRSRSKAQWASYRDRFATLIAEDTALHAEIFGVEFAQGYASVALGSDGPPQRDDE
jgi:hypothetical protein